MNSYKNFIAFRFLTSCLFIALSNSIFCQIIADHTVVDKFDDIPSNYLNIVMKMRLAVAGESHGLALPRGLVQLESIYPEYNVNYIYNSGEPETFTDQHLRVDLYSWGDYDHNTGWIWGYGEEDWFTSEMAITRTKSGIDYCYENNLEMVYGLILCYDGGILDATDYLKATQIYVDYCKSSGYKTVVFFSTGAIDDINGQADERGYQKYKLYEDIRNYVKLDTTRVLFDYADILYYDDNSSDMTMVNWNTHTFPIITEKNSLPAQASHISASGELRLAKAMWWMLARIAGWDGNAGTVPVTGITVNGEGGANTINLQGGTLQLNAAILPANATNKNITWSIQNGTGQATISKTGLVTAVASGTVTARATAQDGSSVFGTLVITISNQLIPVTGITVTGAGGATTISSDDGQLQLSATVLPDNATNKAVTWSVQNGTGQASINASGRLTAIANGTVTARATANDGSGIFGTLLITISNQSVSVTSITIQGAGGANSITSDDGQLQLTASVLPTEATNKTVTWSIENGTGNASISTTGLVTAISNGTVTARATANDGSGVYGSLQITISNQIIEVAGISVTGTGGATTISSDNGQLQLIAGILPDNATNKSVTWSIANGTGLATISPGGLVTAISNGTVIATATANDGSGVTGSLTISISNQFVPATAISVTGQGGSSSITIDNGTLQLLANISPEYATDKTVSWSIENGTGQATINASGLVTAVSNGHVVAVATSNDGSGITGTMTITLSNQVIHVSSITVTGQGGSNAISTDNGHLQLSAAILPSNASNKSVTWSLLNGSGQASIDAAGLVTAIANGTVSARATANDGSGVFGILEISISNQIVLVSEISVTGEGGANIITQENGTLQMIATVTPANATNKAVTWSIHNGTGEATISATGMVTAVSNGTVTARATANDGSGITGELVITISDQIIPVTLITVTGQGGVASISTDNGTLQLNATVSPDDATDKGIIWSIQNGTGQALISNTGLVSAISNGTVTASATANDGSGIAGSLIITITNQVVPVNSITVSSAGGATNITTDEGQLQLTTSILPENASNKTVTWSIENQSGYATINASGVVTALANGTVIARATASDESGVYGTLEILLSNQTALVTSIMVTGAGGSTSIVNDNGQLQLSAAIIPGYAENKSITWTIENGTGEAIINSTGLVTALSNGTVTARASSNDGSGISGTLNLTISNQIFEVAGISLSGPGGSNTINTDNGQLQLTATILPVNATNKTVNWSIQNITGTASISSTGLVTAISDGSVIARATAVDGSLVYGTLTINISNQVIPVTGIIVTGAGGTSVITSNNGQLQLSATVLPANATNPTVTWSVQNGTGQATISPSGLVSAVSDGTVTARATSNDGSGIYGTMQINITSQVIYVAGISITSSGGTTSINSDYGTLQLIANITPLNATTQSVTWAVESGTGLATVSPSGLVTAMADGTVTISAVADDGSGVSGTFAISIYNQTKRVSNITITAAGGITTLTSLNATLQLNATVLPADATNPDITWSIENGTGQASISSTGLLTALAYGSVIARATANDGSGVSATLEIAITNFQVLVQTIVVYGTGLVNSITIPGGTLQMHANIFPAVATNKSVAWSLLNGNNEVATISPDGLLTATGNGEVIVQATAMDGSGVTGILIITITNQSTPTDIPCNNESCVIYFNQSFLTVSLDYSKFTQMVVYDTQGRVMAISSIHENMNEIWLSDLMPGVYLFVFKGKEAEKTLKVGVGK